MIDAAEWIATEDRRSDRSGVALCETPAKEFACTVLDKMWKKVAKGGSNLIHADDETRHGVRTAAKKLRYAAEFFAPLYQDKTEAKRLPRFLMAAERLQDKLGNLNDLVTAPEMLAALGLSEVAGAADLFRADDKGKLLQDAAEAHDTFVETKRFWR